jgi:hypothetical protein
MCPVHQNAGFAADIKMLRKTTPNASKDLLGAVETITAFFDCNKRKRALELGGKQLR